MKRKNKGRKIYKTKEKNYYGKSPVGKFMSGLLTVLLIGGIGFIGYSVAEPIINYTQHKGDKPTSTMPVTTDGTGGEESSSGEKASSERFKAVCLTASDIQSVSTLEKAVDSIPADGGYEYVEVPLKVRGGAINYASSVKEAQFALAVQSDVALSDMVAVIEKSGFKPAAEISTLHDNLLPAVYPESGYVTADDGSQWNDNDPAHDGKPWTTPYSQTTLTYLSDIVSEVSGAGFERIICTDLVYPDFRPSDLAMLDEKLGKSDRFMALTSAANLLYEKSVSNGASMYIGVSAVDMLKGNNDVLQPMLLSANTVVLEIDVEELVNGVSDGHTLYEFEGSPAEITDKCLKFLSPKLTDFNVVVRIKGQGRTREELMKAKEKIAGYGYSSFVIG